MKKKTYNLREWAQRPIPPTFVPIPCLSCHLVVCCGIRVMCCPTAEGGGGLVKQGVCGGGLLMKTHLRMGFSVRRR
jgi:hypothetical protein